MGVVASVFVVTFAAAVTVTVLVSVTKESKTKGALIVAAGAAIAFACSVSTENGFVAAVTVGLTVAAAAIATPAAAKADEAWRACVDLPAVMQLFAVRAATGESTEACLATSASHLRGTRLGSALDAARQAHPRNVADQLHDLKALVPAEPVQRWADALAHGQRRNANLAAINSRCTVPWWSTRRTTLVWLAVAVTSTAQALALA